MEPAAEPADTAAQLADARRTIDALRGRLRQQEQDDAAVRQRGVSVEAILQTMERGLRDAHAVSGARAAMRY